MTTMELTRSYNHTIQLPQQSPRTPARSPSASMVATPSSAAPPSARRPSLVSSAALGGSGLAPLTPSSAQSHQQSLQEMSGVLQELIAEYRNPANELALLRRFSAVQGALQQGIKGKQADMKERIAQICKQTEALKEETAHPASDVLAEQHATLKGEKEARSAEVAACTAELDRLAMSLAESDKENGALQQAKRESESRAAKDLAALGNLANLYRDSTGMEWDYDAMQAAQPAQAADKGESGNSHVVKGTFHFDGAPARDGRPERFPSVKVVQFDSGQSTPFEIANGMWAVMEAHHL